MRIANERWLDALCGEYMLGTLRGTARRRFERALRDETLVAQRLKYWQGLFALRYSNMIEANPSPETWKRLERELELARFRTPWHRRTGFWRGWAVGATAILALVVGMQTLRPRSEAPAPVEIAQLAGKADVTRVAVRISADGRTLELQPARAVIAGPAQSYEVWLIPAEGGDAISIAVLGNLDARFALPVAQVGRVRAGAKLAVTVEPAGGSPTGKATGPIILIGDVRT